MEMHPINISAPSVFRICVDQHRQGDESGRIYHLYSQKPFYFKDTGQLVKTVDAFLDYVDFPQTSVIIRSFDNGKKRKTQERKTDMEIKNNEQAKEQKGAKATFVVHIRYRQNASWQGNVTWVESKQTSSFRSALELLKLIDSALDADKEETNVEAQP